MRNSILRVTLLILVAIIGGIALDHLVNYHRNFTDTKVLRLATVVSEFEYDEKMALDKYANKWVNIRGELIDIGLAEDGVTVLKLKTSSKELMVKCRLRDKIKTKDLDDLFLHHTMNLRGFCKKLDKEIVLEECKII